MSIPIWRYKKAPHISRQTADRMGSQGAFEHWLKVQYFPSPHSQRETITQSFIHPFKSICWFWVSSDLLTALNWFPVLAISWQLWFQYFTTTTTTSYADYDSACTCSRRNQHDLSMWETTEIWLNKGPGIRVINFHESLLTLPPIARNA